MVGIEGFVSRAGAASAAADEADAKGFIAGLAGGAIGHESWDYQRSTNGGSSWDTVSTGLAAQLTAGASPATAVCWLVGRGGVVLLSTDGRNWRRVAFPEATDLSAITARDGRTASVTTADGRTFSTTDAGVTWVPR